MHQQYASASVHTPRALGWRKCGGWGGGQHLAQRESRQPVLRPQHPAPEGSTECAEPACGCHRHTTATCRCTQRGETLPASLSAPRSAIQVGDEFKVGKTGFCTDSPKVCGVLGFRSAARDNNCTSQEDNSSDVEDEQDTRDMIWTFSKPLRNVLARV